MPPRVHVTTRGCWRLAVMATAMAVAPVASRAAVPDAPLAPEAIKDAIERAKGWLIRNQQKDGSWTAKTGAQLVGPAGPTSLALLALANAGLDAKAKPMEQGLAWLRGQTPDTTYAIALQTMVLAMLSPEPDQAILERNVRWLEGAQVADGHAAGSWTYNATSNSMGDNSNSQFALLALHEAARAGIKVNPRTWKLAEKYWVACQNPDGSWGYTINPPRTDKPQLLPDPSAEEATEPVDKDRAGPPDRPRPRVGSTAPRGSMTCAGITSVWITAEHLGEPAAKVDDRGSVLCCGGGRSPKPVEEGLKWLGTHFTVTENPGTRGQSWLFYYLYGLERTGRFTARRFIGDADWFLAGARMFVSMQSLDGSFTAKGLEDPVVATSFALLFLAKGRRPVIVAKSGHGPPDDWNRHGHDVAHLVDHVERRWKKDYPAGLSWHVVNTPAAGAEDLLQAPVLWISGKQKLDLGPNAGVRLRRYIDEGGFVFAEACCPNSRDFDQEFRRLVRDIFPEPEFVLDLLPPEHPAWHAEEIVPPEHQRPLMGVNYGCRTCLIYVPPSDEARPRASLGCLWELGGDFRDQLPEKVRRQVEAALAIGANVLAYATNREVKSKDQLFALPADEEPRPEPIERGRLAIAKLRHAGMCDAAPAALANILRAAARELGTRVDDTPAQIDPGDKRLFDYHLVFMHGRQGFEFDAPRRERIASFLDRGGMLLADAVCASGGFAKAFRAEIALILPGRTLEPVPPDDPLFTALEYGGYNIQQVELREPAGGDGPLGVQKRRVPPKLEGVRIGDRWAVIFSPYDLSCALERANSMECAGYGRDDAEKIALNVLLYSLNH